MIWLQVGFAVLTFVVGALLRKPPPEPEAANFEDFGFPDVNPSKRIPIIWGKKRIQSIHTMDVVGYRTRKIKVGNFITGKKTVGFRYYAGVQVGICRGSADGIVLKKILLGNKVLWEGTSTVSDAGYEIYVRDDDYFGKDDGVRGTIRFYPGTPTQNVDSYLDTKHADAYGSPHYTPAYRHVCHAVFEDFYWGNSPTVRQLEFVCERYPNVLSIGANRKINTTANESPTEGAVDLAIPEIVAEILTDDDWGLGESIVNDVDTSNFTDAAATLRSEGNGASLIWNDGDSIEALLGVLMQQANGFVFKRLDTGLWDMKLARDDYLDSPIDGSPADGANLLLFDEDNSHLTKYSRGSWDETFNVFNVNWSDRNLKGKPPPAHAQDMANFSIVGVRNVATYNFPGVHSATLANDLASRQMRQSSWPLLAAEIVTNRTAYTLVPGDVVMFSWDKLEVSRVFMRVNRIDYGTPEQGEIRLSLLQDIFGTSATVFGVTQSSIAIPQSQSPNPVDTALVIDAPHWLGVLMGSDFQGSPVTEKPLIMAKQPVGNSLEFNVHRKLGTDTEYVDENIGFEYAAVGTLARDLIEDARDMSPASNNADRIEKLVVSGVDFVADLNESPGPSQADIKALGKGLILVESTASPRQEYEFMAYESADVVGSTVTLYDVHRGLIDTVPQGALQGDRVWFLFDSVGTTERTWSSNADVDVRIENVASTGSAALSANYDLQLRGRTDKPIVPGGVLFGSTVTSQDRYPNIIQPGDMTFSVKRRPVDRDVIDFQQDSESANPPPSPLNTIEIDIYGIDFGNRIFLRTISSTSNSLTYSKADQISDGVYARYFVIVRSVDETTGSPGTQSLVVVKRQFAYDTTNFSPSNISPFKLLNSPKGSPSSPVPSPLSPVQSPISPLPSPRSPAPSPRSPDPSPRSPHPSPTSPVPSPTSPIGSPKPSPLTSPKPSPHSPVASPLSPLPSPNSPVPSPISPVSSPLPAQNQFAATLDGFGPDYYWDFNPVPESPDYYESDGTAAVARLHPYSTYGKIGGAPGALRGVPNELAIASIPPGNYLKIYESNIADGTISPYQGPTTTGVDSGTLGVWVRLTGFSNWGGDSVAIMGWSLSANNSYDDVLYVTDDGAVGFTTVAAAEHLIVQTDDGVIQENTWHFIVVSQPADGTGIVIYVDGQPISPLTTTLNGDATVDSWLSFPESQAGVEPVNFYIGANEYVGAGYERNFQGQIQYPFIFNNSVLTAQQVADLYDVRGSGQTDYYHVVQDVVDPLVWFVVGDGRGTGTAVDMTNIGRHQFQLQDSSGPVFHRDVGAMQTSYFDNAVSFGASTSSTYFESSEDYTPFQHSPDVGAFGTLIAPSNITGTASAFQRTVFAIGQSETRYMKIGTFGDRLAFTVKLSTGLRRYTFGPQLANLSPIPSPIEWYYVIVTIDEGGHKFFVNGIEQDVFDITTEDVDPGAHVWLGDLFADGTVDDIRISGRLGSATFEPWDDGYFHQLWYVEREITNAEAYRIYRSTLGEYQAKLSPYFSPRSPVPSPLSPTQSPRSPVQSPISPVASPLPPESFTAVIATLRPLVEYRFDQDGGTLVNYGSAGNLYDAFVYDSPDPVELVSPRGYRRPGGDTSESPSYGIYYPGATFGDPGHRPQPSPLPERSPGPASPRDGYSPLLQSPNPLYGLARGTITVVFKRNTRPSSTDQILWMTNDASEGNYYISVSIDSNGRIVFDIRRGSSGRQVLIQTNASPSNLCDGKWHMVHITQRGPGFDSPAEGLGIQMFIDGQGSKLSGSTDAGFGDMWFHSFTDFPLDLWGIGGRHNGTSITQEFTGTISYFAISEEPMYEELASTAWEFFNEDRPSPSVSPYLLDSPVPSPISPVQSPISPAPSPIASPIEPTFLQVQELAQPTLTYLMEDAAGNITATGSKSAGYDLVPTSPNGAIYRVPGGDMSRSPSYGVRFPGSPSGPVGGGHSFAFGTHVGGVQNLGSTFINNSSPNPFIELVQGTLTVCFRLSSAMNNSTDHNIFSLIDDTSRYVLIEVDTSGRVKYNHRDGSSSFDKIMSTNTGVDLRDDRWHVVHFVYDQPGGGYVGWSSPPDGRVYLDGVKQVNPYASDDFAEENWIEENANTYEGIVFGADSSTEEATGARDEFRGVCSYISFGLVPMRESWIEAAAEAFHRNRQSPGSPE